VRRLPLGDMSAILFMLALALCILSTAGYLLSLLVERLALAKISTWILIIAFGFLTINLFLAVINPAGLAALGSREFFSFYAWVVAGVYLAFQMKTKTRILGAFISPFILLLMIAATGSDSGRTLLKEDMRSWLPLLHLSLTITGEALFVLASCAGAMFVIQNSLIKHKRLNPMSRLFPALNELDRINHMCLLWGFPVLTLGLFAGVVFARLAWETGWYADPKVIWTFAVWLTYGFLLHQRLAIGWKGIRMAVLSCAVFILFLLSYLGVRILFLTMHNFI
jgi:ABC-type transport system involved in cytochrome c biogenesis permease subunit